MDDRRPDDAPREHSPRHDRSDTAGAARRYRLLFYLACGLAFGALGLAWHVAQRARVFDPVAQAEQRDAQYAFVVEAYGFKYRGRSGNVIDEHILQFGAWEKDKLFFVRDYLRRLNAPDSVVIDVGANTGHHALFYSRHAHRVLAYEPFPPVIAAFKANLALNPHVQNVDLFELGLGDDDAELPFAAPVRSNHGQGSFRTEAPQDPGMKTFDRKLRIVVGDEHLGGLSHGPVVFIKIDVEGFEEAVMKGLRQTLEEHRPLLQVEVSLPPTGTLDSLSDLQRLLPERYELLTLKSSTAGKLAGAYSLARISAGAFADRRQLEVIACPAERVPMLPGLAQR